MATERARVETELIAKDKMSAPTDKVAKSVKNLSLQTTALHNVLSGFFTRQILDFGKNLIESYHIQERAVATIEVGALKASETLGHTKDDLLAFASELQGKTIFGDEQIMQEVIGQFLTFPNIVGDQFLKATERVLDIASVTGKDLQGVADAVSKALADPIRGVGALRRYNVTISEMQQKTIEVLVEENRLIEAQDYLLGLLVPQYAGIAEYITLTDFGQWEQFKNTLGDLKEELGGLLRDELRGVINGLTGLVQWFKETDGSTKKMLVSGLLLVGLMGVLTTGFLTAALAAKVLGTAMLGFASGASLGISALVIGFILMVDTMDFWGNSSLSTMEKVEEFLVKSFLNMGIAVQDFAYGSGYALAAFYDFLEAKVDSKGIHIGSKWKDIVAADYAEAQKLADEGGAGLVAQRDQAEQSYANLNAQREAEAQELEDRKAELEERIKNLEAGETDFGLDLSEDDDKKSRRTEKEAALFAVIANILLTLVMRQEETNEILRSMANMRGVNTSGKSAIEQGGRTPLLN